MATLAKLYLVKKKAAVRHVFSRPVSAIVTGVIVLMYACSLVPMVLNASKGPMLAETGQAIGWTILAMAFVMQFATMAQKRRSLFMLDDAHYLYTGPYTHRRILRYYALDVVYTAVLLGLISVFPALLMNNMQAISPLYLLFGLLVASLISYCMQALSGGLYVRRLVKGKTASSQWAVPTALALCMAAVAVVAFAGVGFDMQRGLAAFLQSPLLPFVPLLGWGQAALAGALSGSLLPLALGLGALVAACVAATLWLVSARGDFTEASMQDAESFTAYYEKAKAGETETAAPKLRSASVRFGKGAGAVASKNLLLALKGRSFIRWYEVVVAAAYIGLTVWMGANYAIQCAMLLFWQFMVISSTGLVDDLKRHYIYLIPAKPVRKLAATLQLPMLKSGLFAAGCFIAGGLLLGEAPLTIAMAVLLALSYVIVFIAGNVLSLRVLKSRSNKLVENTLRMVVVLLAAMPGAGVLGLVWLLTGGLAAGLILPVLAAANFVVAMGFLALCAPMLKGSGIAD